MPLMISLALMRPNTFCTRSPAIPYQLARMPISVVGCAITAGVHSTVWIFAISAAMIRRAWPKSCSSSQAG